MPRPRPDDKFKNINIYGLLSIHPTCTPTDLQKAYKAAALSKHPDKNLSNPNATKEFQYILDVYNLLKDPNRRAEYDYNNKSFLDRVYGRRQTRAPRGWTFPVNSATAPGTEEEETKAEHPKSSQYYWDESYLDQVFGRNDKPRAPSRNPNPKPTAPGTKENLKPASPKSDQYYRDLVEEARREHAAAVAAVEAAQARAAAAYAAGRAAGLEAVAGHAAAFHARHAARRAAEAEKVCRPIPEVPRTSKYYTGLETRAKTEESRPTSPEMTGTGASQRRADEEGSKEKTKADESKSLRDALDAARKEHERALAAARRAHPFDEVARKAARIEAEVAYRAAFDAVFAAHRAAREKAEETIEVEDID